MKNTMQDLLETVENGRLRGVVNDLLMKHLVALAKNFHPDGGVEIAIILMHRDFNNKLASVATVSPSRELVPLEEIASAIIALIEKGATVETRTKE